MTSSTQPRFQLVLVRHGLTDWNEEGRLLGRSDVALNVRGRGQAESVARALRSFPVTRVYTSPQRRTRETADPIAAAHGLEPVLEPGVEEVWLTEAWQGKTVPELRGDVELERTIADPTYRSPSIEAIEDVQRRAVAVTERLREERPEETVVVVSHGDPLRAIASHYLGLSLASFRRLVIDNGSITLFRFRARGPQLALLNWRPTLDGPRREDGTNPPSES